MKNNRLYLLVAIFLLVTSCSNKFVVNNAFVYLVSTECYKMGKISGDQWQPVKLGEHSSEVTAVPNKGYIFSGWSDGNLNASRSDLAVEDNCKGPIFFYAYFVEEVINA